VQGISFDVNAGEIRTLVGANGAGKSTTLLALSGLVKPKAGSIRFEGEELTALKTHQIVERGLVQVAEGRAILTTLTVRENLELGAYRRKDRTAIASDLERVLTLFPRLKERLDGLAGNLSGGEQQMLAIGRALLARPRLLLLDEPVAGMNSGEKVALMEVITKIAQRGFTVFMIEHDMRFVMGLCERIAVLNFGKIIAEGTPEQIKNNPDVIEAYLGRDDDSEVAA
jgi:branched-chain amino acid transport system ATP-binding protein